MKEKLNEIMKKEFDALKQLLTSLEQQHNLCIKRDIFGLEAVSAAIEEDSKGIAKLEVERRKLVGENSMSKLIKSYEDESLEDNFRKIKILLEEIQLQKETNELLIKQNLIFTNKMLMLINPNRNMNLYKANGTLSR